ncbi:MAG: hypothetical protein ACFFD2_15730 [Promethearchaeota archaeon]
MTVNDFIIDTNVYYSYIEESIYEENYLAAQYLLQLIYHRCENKICMCTEIKQEFDKFVKKMRLNPKFQIFKTWLKKMHQHKKFLYMASGSQINLYIHDDDECFFSLACNTTLKVVVTQEEKHLTKREYILQEIGVTTYSIQEAIDLIDKKNQEN